MLLVDSSAVARRFLVSTAGQRQRASRPRFGTVDSAISAVAASRLSNSGRPPSEQAHVTHPEFAHPASTRARLIRPGVGVAALCAASLLVAGGVFLALRAVERASDAALRDQLLPSGEARPVAEVARSIAALKLVTVEIDTRVSRTARDQSWRGDVEARVEAPVRLHYGVDLSGMDVARVAFSPASSAWIVRVPSPTRIATEVLAEREIASTQLGWLRFAAVSGEHYLGQARRGLHERARELVLPPEEAQRVVETTRSQLVTLIQKIVGTSADIRIVFDADSALARSPS
jgi:hypothetical protein